MPATQNLNNILKKPQVFISVICLILIVCFLILVPKLTSRIDSQKRTMLLNTFISVTKKDHRIDPKAYWQFREFYSPGYFTFSRTGIPIALENSVLMGSKVTIDDVSILPFLRFSSPLLNSVDYLTTKNTLSQTNSYLEKPTTVLYEDTNSFIYTLGTNHIVIMFLLPLSEMEKANGFFEYNNRDKKLVEGKYWLNITDIKTN